MSYKLLIGFAMSIGISIVSGMVAFHSTVRLWNAQDKLRENEGIIQTIMDQATENDKLLRRVMDKNMDLSDDLATVRSDLDNMKGRSNTALKKPDLVEKMIGSSFDEFGKDMACVTGVQSSCL